MTRYRIVLEFEPGEGALMKNDSAARVRRRKVIEETQAIGYTNVTAELYKRPDGWERVE